MLDNTDFDSWAGSYDGDVRASAESYPFAGYDALMDEICARVCRRPGGRVLDLGCGTGLLAARLAAAGCSVTGLDFSDEMLAEARRRAGGAEFRQWDFSRGLPGDLAGKYDFVTCTYAIHHLSTEQMLRLLREALYVLRPGGEVLVGDVAFETRGELSACRAGAGGLWDDEENYPVAEELRGAFPELGFVRVSFCAGILSLRAGEGALDPSRLLPGLDVRPLRERDVPEALELCRGNGDYYRCLRSEPTAERLLADTLAHPPGTSLADKYFLLARDAEGPLALLDLAAGYPDGETAWIGLFMLRREARGRGLGRELAGQLLRSLREAGFARAGLAWAGENPVPGRFWPSLGFAPVGERGTAGGYRLITAYRAL